MKYRINIKYRDMLIVRDYCVSMLYICGKRAENIKKIVIKCSLKVVYNIISYFCF